MPQPQPAGSGRAAPPELTVPILDFGAYLDERTGEADRAALLDGLARQLSSACRDVGFYFLRGAGALVPDGLVRDMFDVAAQFHGLDLPQKLAYRLDPKTQNGYMPNYADVDRPTNTLRPGDSRALNLMTSRSAFNAAFFASRANAGGVARADSLARNPWPDPACPELRRAVTRYDAAMDALATRMLPVYAKALGLPAGGLLEKFAAHALFNYRLTHYPETPESAKGKLYGIYPHADIDLFTILAQNEVPGLSLKLPSGEWMSVPALPNTFLINTGEILRRMTNGKWLNTVHRVENKSGRERYAVVCFVSLDKHAVLDTIVEPGAPPPPWGARFTAGDVYRDVARNPRIVREQAASGAKL